jgi:hypothetical protein
MGQPPHRRIVSARNDRRKPHAGAATVMSRLRRIDVPTPGRPSPRKPGAMRRGARRDAAPNPVAALAKSDYVF